MRLRSRCGVRGSDHRAGKSDARAAMRSLSWLASGDGFGGLAFVVFLGLAEGAQRVVPVGFEVDGHESVVGVHGHVSPPCLFGVVPGPFDVLAAQPVGFGGATFELGLHGEGDVEGDGGDGGEEEFADGGVEGLAGNRLADGGGVFDPSALADVFRVGDPSAGVIAHGHALRRIGRRWRCLGAELGLPGVGSFVGPRRGIGRTRRDGPGCAS